MVRLQINGYDVACDAAATAMAYMRIATPGPKRCGCWYCRNWASGRDRLVPSAVRDLLLRLGIPLAGEEEVWEVPGLPGEDTPHLYGGWYLFVGQILVTPDPREFLVGAWRLSFSRQPAYGVAAFAGFDVAELHFLCPVGNFIEPDTSAVGR